MKDSIKEIIDTFLEDFKYNLHFENEHFIYWIKGDFFYDNFSVDREEFELIKRYAAYNGTLPCVTRREKKRDGEKTDDNGDWRYQSYSDARLKTGTYSREYILRYSKTYGALEYYTSYKEVRAGAKNKHNRVLVMNKVEKKFVVTNKGFVRIDKRWLSLKNWYGIQSRCSHFINEKLMMLFMTSMLGKKEWIQELKSVDGSILISNKNARKSTSLEDAVNLECGARPAKIFSKIMSDDFSFVYYNHVISLYKLIEPNKIHHITNFIKRNQDRIEDLLYETNKDKGEFILFLYFLSRDNRCETNEMFDYFKMLRENNMKINLDISSYVTLKARHDELSRKILVRKKVKGGRGRLKVGKVYPDIKSMPELGVEKIKSVQRLNRESEMLHHCVHSYKERINSGECAIYSLLFDEEIYTLQVVAEKINSPIIEFNDCVNVVKTEDREEKYNLRMVQLRGKHNCNPPEEMRDVLDKMCVKNNILPVSDSRIYFEKVQREKKKEIVQIGEQILLRTDAYGNVQRIFKDNVPTKIVAVEVRGYEHEEMPF
ncbi:MAG: PcfJ domain-containing protein [Nanoarchaeota archaeon]